MCCITNIYNMLLAQWWRLETNVPNTPFQNNERLES